MPTRKIEEIEEFPELRYPALGPDKGHFSPRWRGPCRVYQYDAGNYRDHIIVIDNMRSFLIQDRYPLDKGDTDFHDTLLRVVEVETGRNLVVWHEQPYWSGLDYGRILSPDQVIEEIKNHPEVDSISRWIEKEAK
ncbi:MAG: hypothetical protein RQM92_09405 [Candidatus Syntrophopropionicum ammoniitolerans]